MQFAGAGFGQQQQQQASSSGSSGEGGKNKMVDMMERMLKVGPYHAQLIVIHTVSQLMMS